MKAWVKRGFLSALLLLAGGILFSLYAGSRLIAPEPREIGNPPDDFSVEDVQIKSESGGDIMGWLAGTPSSKGSVLLLHGVRADRRSMVARARFLVKHSYNVLLIDFQAHGESPGNHITMGHLESLDVVSALDFLRTRFPGKPVGIIGSSLGGAATVLGKYERPPDAIVLESVFSDVTTAVDNRLTIRFGALGSFLTPLLTCQIQPRLGIPIREMSPVERINGIKAPVLFIYGSADQRATPPEGKHLFSLAPEPKGFWLVDGAAHVDMHRFAGEEYEQRILAFFEKHLFRFKE